MDEYSLTSFADEGLFGSDLSQEEQSVIQLKLWRLLSRWTGLYTLGDSSSVRTETAQEILSSIWFLIRLYLKESAKPAKYLVAADVEEVLAQAIVIAEQKIGKGKELYKAACLSMPDVGNISLFDTLKGIGSFFKRYDCRFCAHQIPCDIDYQLCLPVPETLCGIEYITEYLRRLLIENNFIRHFKKEDVIGLLKVYCPDYKGLLINLYEPVLTNAAGLILIHKEASRLNITESEKSKILALLVCLTGKEVHALLSRAAEKLSDELEISSYDEREYMQQTALGLYPRIKAALTVKNIDGIFMSWEKSQ
ncbi:MAG: DUF6179 domain-containing protein [Oscillospiraceae bacterium]